MHLPVWEWFILDEYFEIIEVRMVELIKKTPNLLCKNLPWVEIRNLAY